MTAGTTKKELLGALEYLRAVVGALPAGADLSSAQLDDVRLGCVRTALLLGDDIEAAAAAFGVSQLETRTFPTFYKIYFSVGGVSAAQYREGRKDEETP